MPCPPGKTYSDALSQAIAMRKLLWSKPQWLRCKEDARISELQKFCARLMSGDKAEGEALAREALYRDSAPVHAEGV